MIPSPPTGVDARIRAFVGLLRTNGVPVSLAETLDAGRALALTGLASRDVVHDALACTLVKRSGDRAVFEQLFALYFSGLERVAAELGPSLAAALSEAGLSDDALEALLLRLDRTLADLDPLTRALLEQHPGEVGRRLLAAAAVVDFEALESRMQQGLFTQRLLSAAGFERVERDLSALRDAAAGEGTRESEQALDEVLRRAAGGLRAAARRLVEMELRRRRSGHEARAAAGLLEERPLYALSRDEIERMKEVVARLAERLRDRLERRRKVHRRGHFDVQKTLRANLRFGGDPVYPRFRTKKPLRPDLVVLVDVSDSVRNVARFFLQFTYALQDVFDRVRSFVFVSDLGEATDLFRESDVHHAVDLAFAGRVISLHANSNYGRALRIFHREHLAAVSRRTTVFVLGDGRNNYNPPHDWVLAEIRRRARRLVWLCPEHRRSWGFGDSEMPAYAAHCDHAEVVQRVSDLRRVVEQTLG